MEYEVVIDNQSSAGEIFKGLRPPPRRSTGNHLILDCTKIEIAGHYVVVHIERPSGGTLVIHLPHHAVAAITERERNTDRALGFQP